MSMEGVRGNIPYQNLPSWVDQSEENRLFVAEGQKFISSLDPQIIEALQLHSGSDALLVMDNISSRYQDAIKSLEQMSMTITSFKEVTSGGNPHEVFKLFQQFSNDVDVIDSSGLHQFSMTGLNELRDYLFSLAGTSSWPLDDKSKQAWFDNYIAGENHVQLLDRAEESLTKITAQVVNGLEDLSKNFDNFINFVNKL